MEKKSGFVKKYPLVFGLLTCVVLAVALKYIPANNFFQMAILRFAGALVAILFMLPVLGSKYLKNSKSGWSFTFKLWKLPLIVTVVFSLILSAYSIILMSSPNFAQTGEQLPPAKDLLINGLGFTICIIAVGMVEELSYRRGLFLSAVIQFPKMKNRIMVMAIFSSILFGFAHVAFSLSIETTAIISIILKVIESGIFGFVMCPCLLDGKNIWPLSTVHFLTDFLIAVPQIFQGATIVKREYVQTGFGVLTFASYGIIILTILLYLKPFIDSIKYIKEYEARVQDNESEVV